MAKLYGTVKGMAKTCATRRGSLFIKTCAQSYDGSVITKLTYNDDKLMVSIQLDDDLSTTGETMFYGTFEEFKNLLEKRNKEENE